MTQRDLAEELGITDRAVSKWENGRGMPDVSLMKPLCDLLGITVSELLSGERIRQQDYQEKSECRFLDTMEYTDKKLRKKKILLRVIAAVMVLLLFGTIALFYWLPLTREFFREDEDVEFYWVIKTLPVTPYGEPLERFSLTEFVQQDITEKIDLDGLEELLPLMRVTVYEDEFNTGGFWQGDYIYEIFGCFCSGPRQGKTFHLMIGDHNRNYLMPSGSTRIHTIVQQDTWLGIMQKLEGWEGEYRENFLWESENTFSLYYHGTFYSGAGRLMDLPADAQCSDVVTGISAIPDEECECSFGIQGQRIYQWTEDGQSHLAVQVDYDKVYGIVME